MNRILITGSAGFIGRHLVEHLLHKGYQLTLMDRAPIAMPGVQVWNADLLSDLRAFQGERFDGIVHLAAMLPHAGAFDDVVYRVNVDGTKNILNTFATTGTQMVFLSTGLVYGTDCNSATEGSPVAPQGVYERSKMIAESCVLEHMANVGGIASILRPSVIYGDGASPKMFLNSMLQALYHKQEFPMTQGEQWRDFIHIRDVVQALELILSRKVEGVFNLSSGISVTISEVADYVGKLTGQADLIRKGAIPYRTGEAFHYSLNSEKLRKACQWSPSVTLQEGIQELWTTLCKRGTL